MKPRLNIAADIPGDLAEADEALARYGRWAAERGRRRQRCGSAEGRYQADDPTRRSEPVSGMTLEYALICQRALAMVASIERDVLRALYIPQRLPPQAQLRILRIPPRLSQDRHLAGLRMFANLLRRAP